MKYSINDETLAILPNGKKGSEILEEDNFFASERTTKKVIEDSCEYFGVSYNSRLEGSTNILNTKYKNPIIVEEINRIIFFPVNSPIRSNALWVSFKNIRNYYPTKNKKKTLIEFNNGKTIEIDVSYYSFNQQYLKASKLNSILSNRKVGK